MSLCVQAADLRTAARLTSRIRESRGFAGRDHPWRELYRIVVAGGRLIVMMTDGESTLEWSIPADGDDTAAFEAFVDSSSFDALSVLADDDGTYVISRDDGLVFTRDESDGSGKPARSRRLFLPGRDGPAFRPRVLAPAPEARDRTCMMWTATAAPLARAFAFVAPFIDARNPRESRSVATWTTDGDLVGGNPKRAALVSGLPPAGTPLSFGRGKALAIAAFLERLRGDVEVRAEGAHSAFTCTSSGHVLELRGRAAPFPVHVLGRGDPPGERIVVDRKLFFESVNILEVNFPGRKGHFEILAKGEGEIASIRLATPGSPITRSTDEIAVIRYPDPPGNPCGAPPAGPGGRPTPSVFRVEGGALREALSGMAAVSLNCHFNPRRRHLRLEEVTTEGEMARSVILSVLVPEAPGGQEGIPPSAGTGPVAGSEWPVPDGPASVDSPGAVRVDGGSSTT